MSATHTLSDSDFGRFQALIRDLAGIHLSDAKKALVSGRLSRRLRELSLDSFGDYYRLVTGGDAAERQAMVDLLTTNETYFFREPRHFDLLRERILPAIGQPPRIWSAAASTGQEPYSLAMTLADVYGVDGGWELLATDISTRVLATARRGLYAMAEARRMPPKFLQRYCLRGVRSQEGNFVVGKALRERVAYRLLNLNGDWPESGRFHVIFLRNVMIYFERDTKARLVERLADRLLPGGHLIIGHAETLNGVSNRFRAVVPSVYRLA